MNSDTNKDVVKQGETSIANSFNSNLDMQKHLYDTGLQNIFNEYESNIANLDANKQKEIADAYYLKELSKKYLAEYASNNDIGDVSGNLIDIYGKYQSNINDINTNYDNLKVNFEGSYRNKKNEYDLGLLDTQMQLQYEEQLANKTKQQEENLGRITNALATGNLPEGMDVKTFLEKEKDNLSPSQYWSLKTEYDLTSRGETLNEVANSVNKYDSQQDWDKYIDELVSSGKINSKDAQSMKDFYEPQRQSTFELVADNTYDLSYFSTSSDVVKDGKVYANKAGDSMLAETNKTYDSSSGMYAKLEERASDVAYDTPFGHNGKWFVKQLQNGEEMFVELTYVANPNKLASNYSITPENENQKEQYEYINSQLEGKSGFIETDSGRIAYEYDKETKTYKQYLDFKAFNVKGEKGDFLINGTKYQIKKGYNENGKGGMVDVKDNLKNGQLTKGTPKEKEIVNLFLEKYFANDTKAFDKYVKGSRNWIGTNKVSSKSSMVVLYNGAYYTINDGELWELKKAQ